MLRKECSPLSQNTCCCISSLHLLYLTFCTSGMLPGQRGILNLRCARMRKGTTSQQIWGSGAQRGKARCKKKGRGNSSTRLPGSRRFRTLPSSTNSVSQILPFSLLRSNMLLQTYSFMELSSHRQNDIFF